jgi:hypothetical protein
MSGQRPASTPARPAAPSGGIEHALTPATISDGDATSVSSGTGLASPAMRLQVLSTEHWSLLASRGLAWSDAYSRTSMFLSTLSFAVVALALVAQASSFGDGFRLFALAVLPVVLFLGIGTLLRLDASNYHELLCVVGMNRIRARYLELAPDLEDTFVMGTGDDWEGILKTMALVPGRPNAVNHLAATPIQIAVLDSVLVAAIASLLAMQLGASDMSSLIIGAAGFLLALGSLFWYTQRTLQRANSTHHSLFPSGQEGARRA